MNKDSIKRIFVTGASGYIGQNLCLKLAENGGEVVALYRKENKIKKLREAKIQLMKADLLEMDGLSQKLEGFDVVYHLAALAGMWAPDMDVFMKVNYDATRKVLENAKMAGVKRVVVTSTAGVLGPSNGNPVSENASPDNKYYSEYVRTKYKSENFIRDWDSNGMDIVIVNPARVYGPGYMSESNAVTRIINKYLNGNFRFIPGEGDQIANYSFIDDVVQGHILAMEKGRHRERYILGGDNSTLLDLFKLVREISGKEYTLYPIPLPLIRIAAHFYLLRANIFGIPPLITPSWVAKLNEHDWELSNDKARQELGYTITPLKEGLRKTIAWLQNEKSISKKS